MLSCCAPHFTFLSPSGSCCLSGTRNTWKLLTKFCSDPRNSFQREGNLFFLLPHKPGVLKGWFCRVWAEFNMPVLYSWEMEAELEVLTELPCNHPSWIPGWPSRNGAGVVARAVLEMDWRFPGCFFKSCGTIHTFRLVWQQKNVHFLWITECWGGKVWGRCCFVLSLREHEGTLCRSELLAQRTGRGL